MHQPLLPTLWVNERHYKLMLIYCNTILNIILLFTFFLQKSSIHLLISWYQYRSSGCGEWPHQYPFSPLFIQKLLGLSQNLLCIYVISTICKLFVNRIFLFEVQQKILCIFLTDNSDHRATELKSAVKTCSFPFNNLGCLLTYAHQHCKMSVEKECKIWFVRWLGWKNWSNILLHRHVAYVNRQWYPITETWNNM